MEEYIHIATNLVIIILMLIYFYLERKNKNRQKVINELKDAMRLEKEAIEEELNEYYKQN